MTADWRKIGWAIGFLGTLGLSSAVCAAAAEPDAVVGESILAIDSGGHTGWIGKLLLNGYHDQLISVARDRTIRFWDLASGEPLHVLRPPIGPGQQGEIYTAAISPDGNTLAIGGETALRSPGDERILLIGLPGGEITRTLRGHTGPVRALAFSPDGKRLASGSEDFTARVWDVETGESTRVLSGHRDRVYGLAWNADGSRVATGSWDHTGRIWSPDTGATTAVLSGHTDAIISLDWSPDGRTIATAGDHNIRMWESNGQFRRSIALNNDGELVQFSADSSQLLCSWTSRYSGDIGTAVFDVATGIQRARDPLSPSTVTTGVFLPGDKYVATAGAPGVICIWGSSDARPIRSLKSKGSAVRTVAWSPDGRTIAWGTKNWQHQGLGTLERSFCLSHLDFGPSPKPDFVRSQIDMDDLHIHRKPWAEIVASRNGYPISTIKLPYPDDKIYSQTLVSGRRFAVGCTYALTIYDALSGRGIYTLPGHTGGVKALAPSPDGKYLLSGSDDQTMEIWSLESYQLVLSLFFAGDEWIAWTPQGYYAASLAGEGLMGWHINHGPDQMADFYPSACFHRSRYRPDVIRRVIDAGTPLAALHQADAALEQRTQPQTVSASLPPQVTITSPVSSNELLTASTIRIEATAKSRTDAPIVGMNVLVDGRPIDVQRDATPFTPSIASESTLNMQGSWTLTLTPGEHRLAVKADTDSSYGISNPVTVRGTPEKAAQPRLFVLAIGVSRHADDGLRLKTAGEDAQALSNELKRHGAPIFREVLTHVLTDRDATRAGCVTGLDWLRHHMTTNDVGIICFCGRGTLDAQGEYCLSTYDYDAKNAVRSVTGSELKQFVRTTSGQLLIILDACHGEAHRQQPIPGNAGQGVSASRRARSEAAAAYELLRQLSSEEFGAAVIGVIGISDKTTTTPHVSLASVAAQALSGAADANQDGVMRLGELQDYLQERLKTLTEGETRAVTRRPALGQDFPLGKP